MTEMTRIAAVDTERDPCEVALAECPELAELLGVLATMDRLAARAVGLVGRLQSSGEAETATGLPLELWVSARGRRTASDRRMLGTAADVLAGMRNTADAFETGQLSWSQVRAIVLACERLPGHLRTHVDIELAREMPDLADAEPDEAVRLVRQAVASHDGDLGGPEGPPPAPEDRFVHVQPRLDGSGGRIFGELDAVGLAVFDRATDPGPGPGAGDGPGSSAGRRRADRLVDALASTLSEDPSPDADHASAGGDGAMLPIAPSLLVTTTLDALLGRDDTPAELLAGLAGGRLKVPGDIARRLVDEGGAAVRLLVLDDTGAVLGIGRRNRQPPRWLSDATLALDRSCAQPGCTRPAVHCDVDHVRPWIPDGRTDLPNLQRLCRHHNRTTGKTGWRVTTRPDGSRIWAHDRSGLRVRSIPATRRLRRPRDGPG